MVGRVGQWCEHAWCSWIEHLKMDHTFYIVCHNLNSRNTNVSVWLVDQAISPVLTIVTKPFFFFLAHHHQSLCNSSLLDNKSHHLLGGLYSIPVFGTLCRLYNLTYWYINSIIPIWPKKALAQGSVPTASECQRRLGPLHIPHYVAASLWAILGTKSHLAHSIKFLKTSVICLIIPYSPWSLPHQMSPYPK